MRNLHYYMSEYLLKNILHMYGKLHDGDLMVHRKDGLLLMLDVMLWLEFKHRNVISNPLVPFIWLLNYLL